MKKFLAAVFFLSALIPLVAEAQPVTSPDPCGPGVFYYGNVLTPSQWLLCFQSKQGLLGYVPVNKAGDAMLGPLGITQTYGTSGTPTVAAGAGAGTGPSVTLIGAYDSDFELDVTTGTSPSASAAVATITFSTPYPNSLAHCVISPLGGNAAALSGATQVFVTPSSGATVVLTAGASALAATTFYNWSFMCQG